jgi:hypothetical protein
MLGTPPGPGDASQAARYAISGMRHGQGLHGLGGARVVSKTLGDSYSPVAGLGSTSLGWVSEL